MDSVDKTDPHDLSGKPAERVSVHEVGARRQRSWLELRGTVLVYHVKTWVGTASTYIPVEWVDISRDWRMRPAKLLSASFLVCASVLAGFAVYEYAGFLMPLYAVALFAVLLYAAVSFRSFWRGHPTVRFDVDLAPRQFQIECWDQPGRHSSLTRLTKRILALQRDIDEHVPYPVHMTYQWYSVKPLRASIVQALFITMILAWPVHFAVQYFEIPLFYGFLVLPSIYYLGRVGWNRATLAMAPPDFRQALAAHDRQDYEAARSHLTRYLEDNPNQQSALMLLSQMQCRLHDYNAALRTCDRFARQDPELASHMQEEILGMQRMHDRMHPPTAGAT